MHNVIRIFLTYKWTVRLEAALHMLNNKYNPFTPPCSVPQFPLSLFPLHTILHWILPSGTHARKARNFFLCLRKDEPMGYGYKERNEQMLKDTEKTWFPSSVTLSAVDPWSPHFHNANHPPCLAVQGYNKQCFYNGRLSSPQEILQQDFLHQVWKGKICNNPKSQPNHAPPQKTP